MTRLVLEAALLKGTDIGLSGAARAHTTASTILFPSSTISFIPRRFLLLKSKLSRYPV